MEIGKYYRVEENNFWMIGRVETVGGLEEDGYYRGKAIYISCQRNFSPKPTSWSYGRKDVYGKRTYREATPQEIVWLEYCIQKDEFVEQKDIKVIEPRYEIY